MNKILLDINRKKYHYYHENRTTYNNLRLSLFYRRMCLILIECDMHSINFNDIKNIARKEYYIMNLRRQEDDNNVIKYFFSD